MTKPSADYGFRLGDHIAICVWDRASTGGTGGHELLVGTVRSAGVKGVRLDLDAGSTIFVPWSQLLHERALIDPTPEAVARWRAKIEDANKARAEERARAKAAADAFNDDLAEDDADDPPSQYPPQCPERAKLLDALDFHPSYCPVCTEGKESRCAERRNLLHALEVVHPQYCAICSATKPPSS
jgi:hypothetical protein